MRSLKGFYKEVNLLNIILFAGVVAFAAFAVAPLFIGGVKFTLPAAKARAAAQQEAPASASAPAPSPSDYAAIAENNLFHPERRTPKEEKPLPKPELVLYGTIVAEGASVAYIEDKKSPKTTPGRGKRQTAVKKGDVISGFVLKEIEADRIVLARGEETMVVYLKEEKRQRESETTLSPSKAPARPQPTFLPVPPPEGDPQKAAPAAAAPAPASPALAPAAASAPTPTPPAAPAAQTSPTRRGRGIGQ